MMDAIGYMAKLVPGSIKRRVKETFREQMKDELLGGRNVFCPVCGRGAIAFLPAGRPMRAHVVCPFCQSRERTRMIALYLQEKGLPKSGTKVLHVAPEKGLGELIRKAKDITYVAGDKFEEGYEYPPEVVNMDVTDLPFEDDHFDLIICAHVLEHVPEDRKAMRELYRVLAPGGQAILLVPTRKIPATYEDPSITDPQDRMRHFGQADHVRWYGLDYKNRLEEAGFRAEQFPFNEKFTDEEAFRLGVWKSELMQVGTKPVG